MIEIAGVRTESFEDGKGVRTVIYVQGCNHGCKGCHNPHTWKKGIGQQVSIRYLLSVIEGDTLSTGVTFSGGCPMCNAEALIPLAKEIKARGYSLWSYCGERFEELQGKQLELLQYIDILIDGRFELHLRDDTLAFRGSSNQRILKIIKNEKGEISYEQTVH